MEIIPNRSVSLLPFQAESLANWTEKSDLSQFLYRLFDYTSVAIGDTGETLDVNYSDYGKHLYDNGIEKFRVVSNDFYTNATAARPVPATAEQVEQIPIFKKDTNFGLAAKYAIAWDSVLSAVLSESAFFSLAHVLETDTELDCSVLLASHLYYKQSLQVLRNFLEDVVIELHFCDDPQAFDAWKSGHFRTPPLRGRKGLLKSLVSRGLLTNKLEVVADHLYEELNGSIHGAEARLIHRGIFTGKNAGLIFKYGRFAEWARYFSECVDFGIQALRLTVNHWAENRPDDRIQCDICHQEVFDTENETFADRSYLKLSCRNCGYSMTVDADWAAQRGYE